MDALWDWMASTSINNLVVGYQWTWATLESLHFFGLCLLLGAVLIMDLRLLGLAPNLSLRSVHALMWVAIGGFAINLITGLGFLFGDPYTYVVNYAFWVKMALIVLAGLNFLLYTVKVEPSLARLDASDPTPTSAKAVGAASLVFWFGVLIYGRLLPYLGTGGG